MSLKIKVYSDYVCPFCFLGKDQFEKAIEGKDVEVEWNSRKLWKQENIKKYNSKH